MDGKNVGVYIIKHCKYAKKHLNNHISIVFKSYYYFFRTIKMISALVAILKDLQHLTWILKITSIQFSPSFTTQLSINLSR